MNPRRIKADPDGPTSTTRESDTDLVSVLAKSLKTAQDRVAELEQKLSEKTESPGGGASTQERDELLASLNEERETNAALKAEAEEQWQEMEKLRLTVTKLEAEVEALSSAKAKYRERAKALKAQLDDAQESQAVKETPEALLIRAHQEKTKASVQERQDELISTKMTTFKLEITHLLSLPRCPQMSGYYKYMASASELKTTYEQIMGQGSFQDVFFFPGQIVKIEGTRHYLGMFPYKLFDASSDRWSPVQDYASLNSEVKDMFGSHSDSKIPGITYFGTFKCHYDPRMKPGGHILPKDMAGSIESLIQATLTNVPAGSDTVYADLRLKGTKKLIRDGYVSGKVRVVCVELQDVGFNCPLANALASKLVTSSTADSGKRALQDSVRADSRPSSKRIKAR